MDNKRLSVGIVDGNCFQASDEGAMAQLSLRVCSDDLETVAEGEPLCLLLRGALRENGGDEHANVKFEATWEEDEVAHIDGFI